MRRVTLRGTDVATTALGFGTASLMGRLSRVESLRLLDVAYENGIRHFDTAPLYGYGECEPLLGAFRKRHADITVATKFGLARPQGRTFVFNRVKNIVRPFLRGLPSLARTARGIAQSRPPIVANFDVTAARSSLRASLRRLSPGPIDLYFLHDCRSETLDDESLLQLLVDARRRGEIRAFGIATDFATIVAATERQSGFAQVLQFANNARESNLTDRPQIARDHACITHSPFGGYGRSAATDAGQRHPLEAAVAQNPAGIVIFSSQRAENIARNAHVLGTG